MYQGLWNRNSGWSPGGRDGLLRAFAKRNREVSTRGLEMPDLAITGRPEQARRLVCGIQGLPRSKRTGMPQGSVTQSVETSVSSARPRGAHPRGTCLQV